jgi:hypothetical protein
MLPDIDTLAKLLLNADSPRPHNNLPVQQQRLTNADVYGPGQEGNVLPAGTLPDGRIPSELARILRSLQAGGRIPYTTPEGDHG